MAHRLNIQEVPNTENVKIFLRNGVKKPIWQILLYQDKAEIIKSSKTTSRTQAIKIAQEMFKATQRGISLDKINFEQACDLFIEHLENKKGTKANTLRDRKTSKRACLTFDDWKNVDIKKIDEDYIEDFVDFREDQDKSASTINSDLTFLRQLFEFCRRKKYVYDVPKIKNVSLKDQESRPSFSMREIRQIARFINEKYDEVLNQNVKSFSLVMMGAPFSLSMKKPKEVEKWFMLKALFWLMYGTGARPSTLAGLKLSSLKKTKGHWTFLGKTNKGKKREQVIVPRRRSYKIIDELIWFHKSQESSKKASLLTFDTNYLSKLFNEVLEELGLTYNDDGEKRTLYSIRHFYITLMLERLPITVIAANTMTSLQMIQRYYDKTDTKRHLRALAK